jgi:hypothetical protein
MKLHIETTENREDIRYQQMNQSANARTNSIISAITDISNKQSLREDLKNADGPHQSVTVRHGLKRYLNFDMKKAFQEAELGDSDGNLFDTFDLAGWDMETLIDHFCDSKSRSVFMESKQWPKDIKIPIKSKLWNWFDFSFCEMRTDNNGRI